MRCVFHKLQNLSNTVLVGLHLLESVCECVQGEWGPLQWTRLVPSSCSVAAADIHWNHSIAIPMHYAVIRGTPGYTPGSSMTEGLSYYLTKRYHFVRMAADFGGEAHSGVPLAPAAADRAHPGRERLGGPHLRAGVPGAACRGAPRAVGGARCAAPS